MSDDDGSLAGWFNDQLERYSTCYLTPGNSEYEQSGWHGTPENWRAAREVILDGVTSDGDVLDIGCANGLLLASLIEWGSGRGVRLTPHGIDFVPGLIELARTRFPDAGSNFSVANAFDWTPARRYNYVHTLLEYVPKERQPGYIQRLLDEAVVPGGRLLVSSYGDQAEQQRPIDIDLHLQMLGFQTAGCSNGMQDDRWVATRTAWIERS